MKKSILTVLTIILGLSSLSANTTHMCDLDMVHYMKTDERKQSTEKNYLKYSIKDKQLMFTVQDKSSFVATLDDVTSDSKIYETDTGIRIVLYDNQKDVKLITDTMTAFLIHCKSVK